jgi:hypothetical protein
MPLSSKLPRLIAAVAAVLVFAALAAPGIAAGPKKFRGTTEHNRPISFKVKGKKVRKFVAGINTFCVGQGIQFRAVIPPGPMKIHRGGKFSYNGPDKGDDTEIQIRGRIKGRKAKGKIQMSYAGCSGAAKWKAKRR